MNLMIRCIFSLFRFRCSGYSVIWTSSSGISKFWFSLYFVILYLVSIHILDSYFWICYCGLRFTLDLNILYFIIENWSPEFFYFSLITLNFNFPNIIFWIISIFIILFLLLLNSSIWMCVTWIVVQCFCHKLYTRLFLFTGNFVFL